MNERKLFQSSNQNEKIESQKQKIVFEVNCNCKKLNSKSGITLIALVISIIVMLILAGVSLNATIGDNGIITQAQNATYMQSIAVLEEYLQTEYVKYYDETENYTSKIELLSSKIGNLCLKDGTKNYITYDGKMYYLINKQNLPDDVKNQLKGGDTTEYLKYIRLQDVYGVTPDLKVYYCENGTDSVLGTLDSTELDPTTPLKKINQDAEMKSAITEALESIGVTVGENGVTVGDASKLKNIELDGSKHNITSISGLSELSSLKTVTLSNLTLSNLDGLENCTLLYYVYFKNCKINDYSNLSTVLDLQYLYLYLPPSMSEADANAQVNNLGNGLASATELNKLEYFGIFGNTDMIDGEYSLDTGTTPNHNKYQYNSNVSNNLTNIEGLKVFSNNIKNTIQYMYLNNNLFNNIESLQDFSNLYELDIMCCRKLLNLNGLNNHGKLVYIFAQNCDLNDISGLDGTVNLKYLTMQQNVNLVSLHGLENSINIDYIRAFNCNITDITAISNNRNLRMLNLESNVNLENIITLGTCTGIKKLYLANNEKMIGAEVRDALADPNTHILQNCGGNYTIPSKYNIYFATLTSYDYSNLGLTDNSDEINALKNKTNVTRLNLSENPELSNEKLQEILSTMTGLKALSLNGCKKLSSLDFIGQGKVTQLVELDLRDTNTELIDLSNLNNYANNLQTLIINNTNTDMRKIVKTLNGLTERYSSNYINESWLSKYNYSIRGLVILGELSEYNFEGCDQLSKLIIQMQLFTNQTTGTLDLSMCNNLIKFSYGDNGGYFNAKLPNSVKDLSWASSGICKVSENTNLNSADLRFGINSFFKNLPDSVSIKSIRLNGSTGIDFENLNKLSNKQNFENFECYSSKDLGGDMYLRGFEKLKGTFYAKNVVLSKVSGISKEFFEHFPYIEKIQLVYSNNVTSIEGIENCTNLRNLEVYNCSISSIQSINNLDKLNLVNVENNKISDISAISNLKNVKELILSNNSINDLSALENLIENKNTNLQSLYLTNNIIQTNTVVGHNNVETLKKLYDAGLRSLYISGNNFTAGSTDELKNLKWTNYQE